MSARAGVTNSLIERAKAIHKNPSDRELDVLMTCGEQETIALLCMALDSLGVPAVSRTGWQAGIITEGLHAKSRIREVSGGDIRKQLRAGNGWWLQVSKASIKMETLPPLEEVDLI